MVVQSSDIVLMRLAIQGFFGMNRARGVFVIRYKLHRGAHWKLVLGSSLRGTLVSEEFHEAGKCDVLCRFETYAFWIQVRGASCGQESLQG
jgi:hypothetical protein